MSVDIYKRQLYTENRLQENHISSMCFSDGRFMIIGEILRPRH